LISNTEEKEEVSLFTVYPNPASDIINVDFGSEKSGLLTVYNLQGQRLSTQRVRKQRTTQVTLAGFPDGLHLMKFVDEKGNESVESFVVD